MTERENHDQVTWPDLEPVFKHPEDYYDYQRERYDIHYDGRKALVIVACLVVMLILFFLIVVFLVV